MALKALNLKVPRLGKNRHGTYFVRAPAQGSGKVTQQSLHTKDPRTAKILALQFCTALARGDDVSNFSMQKYYIDTSAGKVEADTAEDHARAIEAIKALASFKQVELDLIRAKAAEAQPVFTTPPLAAPIPLATSGKRLKAALAEHLEEESRHGLAAQTIAEKRVLFADFIECFGEIALNDVRKGEFSNIWRPQEFRRPNKKYVGKTLSGARLEKRRGYLHKFFAWAIEAGYYQSENPAGQKMASKKEIKTARKSYEEFSGDDLAKLFCAQYTQEMNKPDWYWLPLLALFSGARLGELADLALENFVEIEGVKCYHIRAGKTAESIRQVPIHSALISLGIWDYVQAVKATGATHFVPHRPAEKRSKSVGRQWGVWVGKCGIADRQKVFHSFRSTAITDLHSAEAGHAAIKAAVGHATEGVSGVHGRYIRGVALQKRRETVEMLKHPTVNLAALKLADPTFAAFFAKAAADVVDPRKLKAAASLAKHEAAKAERLARTARMRKT